ncbi:glycosyltransferase 87 family protein [Terrabacter sp. LjRoot27]|uniref:glycosyltransferase 87 family protein n=1 Tax=Terrabacter sp. LjRoot27 TaxID=3342306 RepID=UPI003ECCAD43
MTSDPATAAPAYAAARVATVTAIVLAWLATLPRLVPSTFGDHGTYVSVAERLLVGDRLYVDVWDNKDPLFYYALALGRLVSPLSDVVLEVLWVLGAGLAVLVLARAAGASSGLALVAGLGATPLLLTGPAYESGMTHLPGLALLLAAVACAVRSRWVAAGVLVGLLLLTKLVLAPVVAGALLVVALHRRSAGGLRGLARAVAGAVALLAVGIGAMWLRGELPGWVDNFRLNADYAEGDLASSQYGPVIGHLLRALPEDGRGAGMVTVASLVVVVLVIPRSWRGPGPDRPAATADSTSPPSATAPPRTISPAVLWDLVVVSLTLGLVVIAVTATWPHHAQTFSAPGGFALALIATRLSDRAVGWRAPVVVLLAGYLMAGALHPYFTLTAARNVPTSIQLLQRASPDSVVLDSLPQVRTYARAGSNDASAHAVGLDDLDLVCPRFHQYSLEPTAILDLTATCLPRADAIIVDDTLRPEAGEPDWNAYVARVRALVATGYDCVRTTGSQVCVRRGP